MSWCNLQGSGGSRVFGGTGAERLLPEHLYPVERLCPHTQTLSQKEAFLMYGLVVELLCWGLVWGSQCHDMLRRAMGDKTMSYFYQDIEDSDPGRCPWYPESHSTCLVL